MEGKLLYWEGKFMQREVLFGGEVVAVLGKEVHAEREVLLTESKVVCSAEGMFLGSFVGKVVA